MGAILLNILLFLFVFSLVVCIHELGHFYFAKKAGILCHEFAFGMGPRLISKKIGETTFSIRAFPFGGFVTMAGEELSTDLVKPGDHVRLAFNDDMKVVKIVLNAKHPDHQNLQEIVVETVDLKGEGMAPLYLNGYPVERDAHYVMDRHELQIAPHERSFVSKTKGQRFMVTFAGAMMNLILAFVVYLVIAFAFGVPDAAATQLAGVSEGSPAADVLLAGDEIVSVNGIEVSAWNSRDPEAATITSELAKFREAAAFTLVVRRDGGLVTLDPIHPLYYFYGLGFVVDSSTSELVILAPLYAKTELLAGDEIVSIDGTTFTDWADVLAFADAHPDGSTEAAPTVIVVRRDGVVLDPISFVAYGEDVLLAMGYTPVISRIGIIQPTRFAFFPAIVQAGRDFGDAAISIYRTLWLLLTNPQIKLSDMSGFIGIYTITANAAAAGLRSLLFWIGLLSVNLGVVNLLPIPALDGGRLAFIVYEAITKKKPNRKVENWLHTIMFFLLMALIVFISYNDIVRLITNR